MSVIEREQQQVDPAREGRARVLEAAALEIEVRGWCQVDTKNEAGNVCLIGAVGCVLSGLPAATAYWQAAHMWNGWKTTIDDVRPLWLFNDKRERTAGEVTFVLRWRAAEIRDGR